MRKPVIQINNLSLYISNKKILDNVSFNIYEKDYLSIIGPNGAGKTSLLKCLMRIYSYSEGDVFFRGNPIKKLSQRNLAKQISYVPQSDGRLLPFSVEEFVMMGRYPHLSPFTSFSVEDKKAVKESLELTNINQMANRSLNTLSGGERQTVFIAAALAQGADILLLDEPTTFLDPKHEHDIYRILRKINEELGITIVSVTHDINSAVLQGERIVILKNGAVQFEGEATEIMNKKILASAYNKEFFFLKHPKTGQTIIAPEVPGQ
ncbi:ABC transporter ATP-binding protein [candidate division KSB1 bacterium]|nr:ABC transporter ATP-binding protein [candidate division KSB1 bacterium]